MGFLYALLASLLLNVYTVTDIPYTAVESAFSSGDAARIVSYGKETMLVNVGDKSGAYSQSQASQVLKDFFSRKPASSFKFSFRGKETEEGTFAIGTYMSKTEAFRVTIKWKKMGTDYKIESIGIEKS
jgi:hypothetical protein